MAEASTDRRVRRTRQLLIDALLALIVERGYEALTVQDVLDRADVGRSTFYAHFRDKDDLLAAAFSRLHTVLEGRTGAAGPAGLAELSLALFRHTDEHRPLYRVMVGRPSGAMLTRAVHELLGDHVRVHLRRLGGRLLVPAEVATQYYVSALLGLLTWWLDAERPYTAAEMDAMFRRLVQSTLEPPEDGTDSLYRPLNPTVA